MEDEETQQAAEQEISRREAGGEALQRVYDNMGVACGSRGTVLSTG